MHATPVLLVTDDDLLWQHWRGLDPARWLPARGRGLASLQQWRGQGRQLAVLDASVARLPAWDAPQWQELTAGLRLVVASSRPSDAQGTQVFAAGAYGYCHSHAPLASLTQVLDVVSGGGIWMGRSLVTRLLKLVDERVPSAPAPWQHDRLTERENAVALRAAHGDSNADIAGELGITERTVKAHLSAAFEKLGVSDRLQLALCVHGISTRAPAPRTGTDAR